MGGGGSQTLISLNEDDTISEYQGSWSPDGSKIIYNSWSLRGRLTACELFLVLKNKTGFSEYPM